MLVIFLLTCRVYRFRTNFVFSHPNKNTFVFLYYVFFDVDSTSAIRFGGSALEIRFFWFWRESYN